MSALPTRLLRLPQILDASGCSRSKHYDDISKGLMTPGVKIGARAAAWPAHEAEAINRARIAGVSPAELRNLVTRLMQERLSQRGAT